MKLRNKKTGEIFDALIREKSGGGSYSLIVCDIKAYEQSKSTLDATHFVLEEYDSLAKLNDDWEDYKPTEPLIKDPKIRKAVRAWGDMNQIREAAIQRILIEPRGFEDSWFQISGEDENNCIWKIEIHAPYSETVSKDYKENMVTIAELCGDEEECEN